MSFRIPGDLGQGLTPKGLPGSSGHAQLPDSQAAVSPGPSRSDCTALLVLHLLFLRLLGLLLPLSRSQDAEDVELLALRRENAVLRPRLGVPSRPTWPECAGLAALVRHMPHRPSRHPYRFGRAARMRGPHGSGGGSDGRGGSPCHRTRRCREDRTACSGPRTCRTQRPSGRDRSTAHRAPPRRSRPADAPPLHSRLRPPGRINGGHCDGKRGAVLRPCRAPRPAPGPDARNSRRECAHRHLA